MTTGIMYRRTMCKFILLVAAILYTSCLPLDAAIFDRTCPSVENGPSSLSPVAGMGKAPIGREVPTSDPSWFLLLGGGVALILQGSLGAIGWLANPAAALAVMLLVDRKMALARGTAAAAMLLAASSLHATNHFYLAGDEGGVCRLSAVSAAPGFWLWLSAMTTLWIATFVAPTIDGDRPSLDCRGL